MHRFRLLALMLLAAVLGALTGATVLRYDRSAPPAPSTNDRGGSVWGANYFPNVPLITHEGETIRFFDDVVKGKVVAINFIYTTCPDSCPMETARLLEVKKILGDRVGRDVFFYSITIDPKRDTPRVLKEYAEAWGTGDGWTLLTGSEDDIVLLRRKLGVYIEEIQSEGSLDHNLNLVIGNQKTGRWMRRSPFENPYVLATQLGHWLHNWKLPSRKQTHDYADAPELRTLSAGEDLFRTRCSSCHTVGQGDVLALDQRRIGPDLLNVTLQRDRDWLVRWLAEPDKMLAEEDPLAMTLYRQYNRIPMPNLRLNATDIEQLLDYIERESRRIAQLRAAPTHHGRHHLDRQHPFGSVTATDDGGHDNHDHARAQPLPTEADTAAAPATRP